MRTMMARWYWRLRGDGPLVRIGVAIIGVLALALALAAGVTVAGLYLLHFQGFKREPKLTPATTYDLLKVAFAFAAGIAGVVAMVTAYRRQRIGELAEHREGSRLFNERFATAAGQLGDDQPAAVRLAGVYAMAGLADDWPAQRQICVDVLCAYLRLPYNPDLGDDAPAEELHAFRALREIRWTVIRVITVRLQPDIRRPTTVQDWRGLSLDFTGAVLDGGDFSFAEFTGPVSFDGAVFSGKVGFLFTKWSGGWVSFGGAVFSAGRVSFDAAEFTRGLVTFHGARIVGGEVSFYNVSGLTESALPMERSRSSSADGQIQRGVHSDPFQANSRWWQKQPRFRTHGCSTHRHLPHEGHRTLWSSVQVRSGKPANMLVPSAHAVSTVMGSIDLT